MDIGLVLPHTGPTTSPTFIRDFAQTAEATGISRLWAVDHLVLPHHVDSAYVLGSKPSKVADGWLSDNLAPNYEMVSTLAWVAGQTTTIGLGTSISVLTLRNPLLNARQLATLDVLSGGRLSYGVGIGWMREEAAAMGIPWHRRAARSEEHIELLRVLWTAPGRQVEFHGEFYDFAPIDPEPRPLQRPIPILIGGHSTAALDRAARIGDGWISAPMPATRLAGLLNELRRLAEEHGRPYSALIKVASTKFDTTSSFAKAVDSYRDLGVDHLQVVPTGNDAQAMISNVQEIAALTPPG